MAKTSICVSGRKAPEGDKERWQQLSRRQLSLVVLRSEPGELKHWVMPCCLAVSAHGGAEWPGVTCDGQ